MKVKELIEKLSKCDQELEIYADYDGGVASNYIEAVYEAIIDDIQHSIFLTKEENFDYLKESYPLVKIIEIF